MSYENADCYADVSLVDDPHAYFDYLRAQGPVVRLPYRNAVAVVGYDETVKLRSEEHTSELQSLMRISYSVCCLKKNILIHQRILRLLRVECILMCICIDYTILSFLNDTH